MAVLTALANLPVGAQARLVAFEGALDCHFTKIAAFGLLPGTNITVLQTVPAIVIQIEHTRIALDNAIAKTIIVEVDQQKDS